MGILSGLRGHGGWLTPTLPPVDEPRVDQLSEQLRAEQETSLLLQESLVDAELALEDAGWQRLTTLGDLQFSRDGLRRAAQVGRTVAVTNTLVKRGLALRIAYIWGSGVQVAVRAGDDDTDLVNGLVQAFLDDEGNKAAFTGEQAHEENERALGTDGNVFVALFTAPRTGRVQARTFPFDEIEDVLANPDDRDEPWYYRRRWTATTISPTGVTASSEHVEFYPALGYRPLVRPRFIDGHPVNWDTPILHISVNRLDGWKFGIGDVYTAMPWARAYREFLADWAQLVKALSQFAWRLTGKGRSRAAKAAETIKARAQAAAGQLASTAGATAAASDAYQLEAIPKSGATIDSESGRPLAAMVAAGLDLPVTMLLGDPGVTGARATAETLDQPMQLSMQARRGRWTEAYRRVLGHVVAEAVRAPQGGLQGKVTRDETGREVVTLAGGVAPSFEVTWPPLDKVDVKAIVDAIVAADGTGKMPPLTTVKLLLAALGVEDVDEILAELVDANGDWIDPVDAAAARSQQAAVAAGNVPPA
jgi:hypothetical protein